MVSVVDASATYTMDPVSLFLMPCISDTKVSHLSVSRSFARSVSLSVWEISGELCSRDDDDDDGVARRRRLVRPSPYKSSMIFNLTLAALSLLSRPLARSRTPRDRLRIIRPRGEKEARVILGPGKDISTAADRGHQIRTNT